jgi:hypothetical protein
MVPRLALLMLAGCATSAIPGEPVVADAPYPVRYERLSEPARLARLSAVQLRNPGWTITLDDYGFLISAHASTPVADASVAAGLPLVQPFVDRNRDILGLDAAIDLAHLPAANVHPMSHSNALVYKQPMTAAWFGTITLRATCPTGLPRAGCAFPSIEGHAWPGWRGVPGGKTDHELVARYIGKPLPFTEVRCRSRSTCGHVDLCADPIRTGTSPLRMSDIVVERRLQPWGNPATHALELRAHAIITIRRVGCGESDDGDVVRIPGSLWIPWLDAVTGVQLTP